MENEDITPILVESKIFLIRDKQVMVDRDLEELYGVETKVINQAVKRNLERFPEDFRFQLTSEELDELVTNCDRFKNIAYRRSLYAKRSYIWKLQTMEKSTLTM